MQTTETAKTEKTTEAEEAKATETFEQHAAEYDAWYDRNRPVYTSELLALKKFLPESLKGLKTLEIGVGTGRFTLPLGIGLGLDPARPMLELAKKRGIEVLLGVAETLPFKPGTFDLVLIVTAIAFFRCPPGSLKEISRILKPGGQVVIGMLDRESPLGQHYESKKRKNGFSSGANFLAAAEVEAYLWKLGFERLESCQTLSGIPEEMNTIERAWPGTGKGGFAVLSAWKGRRNQRIQLSLPEVSSKSRAFGRKF
ncbi:MAG: class I SAM-dependent methyltransferase [Methanosarcinaceae archaeon]|nr:class I SAM-dependent methyltransferase [Methanosarcinaceae archaeon]